MLQFVVCFERKAHHALPRLLLCAKTGGNVGGGHKFERHARFAFALDFLLGGVGGCEIGHCGAEYSGMGGGEEAGSGLVHLGRTGYPSGVYGGMLGLQRHGAAHKLHLSAACCAVLGQSQTHFARRTVANVAHGINVFMRGAGGDKHLLTRKVLQGGLVFLMVEEAVDHIENVLGLLHASLAAQVAGQLAVGCLNDLYATRPQRVEVGRGGRVTIHVEVHGRCYEYGRLHRHVGSEQHVVGNAMSHLAQRACGGGGNHHGVGPQPEVDVAVPGAIVGGKELRHDGLTRECRQRDGGDELLAGRCNDHLHLGARLDEEADERAGLVGRNAAGYAQHNVFVLHKIGKSVSGKP